MSEADEKAKERAQKIIDMIAVPVETIEPVVEEVVVEQPIEEVKEEAVEPTPAYLTQTDFLEGIKLVTETLREEIVTLKGEFKSALVTLDDKIAAVSTSVETTQAEEHEEIKQQIADTPAASLMEALSSVIGRKEVAVTKEEATEMGAPKETPVPERGMMFWEREGWTQ